MIQFSAIFYILQFFIGNNLEIIFRSAENAKASSSDWILQWLHQNLVKEVTGLPYLTSILKIAPENELINIIKIKCGQNLF